MSRRSRRQQQQEAGSSERWLITYADLITVLLIFFIVMYAMSKVDTTKFDTLSQVLQFQFKKSDTIIPEGSSIIGVADPNRGKEGERPGEYDQENRELSTQEKEMRQLIELVEQYIAEHQLEAHVFVADTLRGVAITLNDLFLFDLGKAELREAAYPILERLASLFSTLNTTISVEGHTDDLPIASGSLYKDNWTLSSERSLSVIRYFRDKAKLREEMFQSVAHAFTKPVAPNDTSENRQKNRRVEIIILRDLPDSN